MISGHRPPSRPLGEISAAEEDTGKLVIHCSTSHTQSFMTKDCVSEKKTSLTVLDAGKLAASERHTEECISRISECERRLKQSLSFSALLKSRAKSPAAAQNSKEENDRYEMVIKSVWLIQSNLIQSNAGCMVGV